MIQGLFRKKDIVAILHEAETNNGGLRQTLTATNLVALGIGAIIRAKFVASG